MIANVSAFVNELNARAETGKPVTIGLAGAGQMGTDIVVQLSLMPGLRLGAISEVNTSRAVDAALLAGHGRERLAMTKSAGEIDSAIERGRLAITDDLSALVAAGRIDVV
ncbi:MAG TPA: homoserine dehydrogenase, partial [Aestuariivirga sp.]|nr:homoserine dehydrogenase [Aestuariivirga sp.]